MCVCVSLCVNSCCAARISKIEGRSYSVGKVRVGFALAQTLARASPVPTDRHRDDVDWCGIVTIPLTPTAGEWKPVFP
jgi:hypothetical protein